MGEHLELVQVMMVQVHTKRHVNVRYMEPSMIKTYVSDSWPAFLYYDVCHCCVFSIH